VVGQQRDRPGQQEQLLGQVRTLLDRLEAGQPLPAEVRTTLADLTTLAREAGTLPPPPIKALPWLLRVEQMLLGDWQAVTDGQVRCPACGSDQVGRKSATPRLTKFYDASHQVCEVAVARYYCRILSIIWGLWPVCDRATGGSITDRPQHTPKN